jgi:hypothetical protein
MTVDHRALLKFAGLSPLMSDAPDLAWAADGTSNDEADYTLRIAIAASSSSGDRHGLGLTRHCARR